MSILSEAHKDNLVRWEPTIEGGFYESHFVKVNLPAANAAFWCRFTILHPVAGRGPAKFEVWAIYFDTERPERCRAAKETFGAGDAQVSREVLSSKFGNNVLEHGHSRGALLAGDVPFRWDLKWPAPDRGFRHYPIDSMYEAALPKAKVLTPTLDARFKGSITIGDDEHQLTGQRGMQGHNWGKKNAESWVWAHCNHFEQPGLVFEGVSSKIKLGPLSTPQLSILHFDDGSGSPLTVNGWLGMVRTSSAVEGLSWRFRGSSGDRGIEGVISAPPERFVGLEYHDPDGDIANCLNSKVADAEIRILRHEGGIWRLQRTHHAIASSALEIGVRGETRGVRMHL